MARRHHDLRVWQDAMALVKTVYVATAAFPREERFGLTAQMRRSAVSVPSNVRSVASVIEHCARIAKRAPLGMAKVPGPIDCGETLSVAADARTCILDHSTVSDPPGPIATSANHSAVVRAVFA